MKFWQIAAWLGAVAVIGLIVAAFTGLFTGGKPPLTVEVVTAGIESAKADAGRDLETFLTELYSHYQDPKVDFTPLFDKAPDYFDPEMVVLIRRDQSFHELLAFEVDPICDCQDFDKITADIQILNSTATTAKAGVVLTDTGQSPRSLSYDLVKIDGHWRIHDISSQNYPSLRQHIIEADKAVTDTQ